MRMFIVLMFLAIGLAGTPGMAAEWQVADGPLKTPWTDKVDPQNVHPEYPRPQMTRSDWQSLNGLWQFAAASEGDQLPAGRELDEQILVPFPVESALSGIMRREERVWYRRTFEVPEDWTGQKVLLHFGAVDWEASVWVNGTKLGEHRGGYDPFSFDITEALNEKGPQEIVVGVWDPSDGGSQPRGKQVRKPHGIWYTPTTGIWQSVWIEPVPESYIEGLKLTPDVDNRLLRVTVHAAGEDAQDVSVSALDGDAVVATKQGTAGEELALEIAEPKLWSPDSPFLYGLKVTLGKGDQAADTVDSYFGMRKVSVGAGPQGVTRMLLNDEFVFQYGPLDQGFWPDGLYTAPTDEALRYDLEMTKKLGFNMVRKHVKVEPARWYYWCDKLGLLVWQDMPSGDESVGRGEGEITRTAESAKQFEHELQRMLDSFHNSPSIVMWVVFNEGWGQYDTVRLTNWTKHYDPSRVVCGASGWNDMQVGDVHDIHVYPGPNSPMPEPTRAAVLGEYGGLGLPVRGHTWQNEKNWGYRNLKSAEALQAGYLQLIDSLRPLIAEPGLTAAVYTQTTDVEVEVNGLMTYDRQQMKMDPSTLASAHAPLYGPVPTVSTVVATSEKEPQTWRMTTEQPGGDWFKPGFDDAAWTEAPGGFGVESTPGAVVHTKWDGDKIWLRRSFDLPEGETAPLYLRMHYDDDTRVFINGVQAIEAKGYTTRYGYFPISEKARAALQPSGNVLAVHCRQFGGGQFIDVGLTAVGSTDGE